MGFLPISIGIIIGCAILWKLSDKKDSSDYKPDIDKKTSTDKQQRLNKYLKALENSSVKDFQAMIKKIEDEDERKEVMEFIKAKANKPQKKRFEDQTMEEQFMDAADSFGKNVCTLFTELLGIAIVGTIAAHIFGYINIFQDLL